MKDVDLEAEVHKYRNGLLGDKEREVVLQNISKQTNWAEEYQLQEDLEKAIQNVEHGHVKNILKQHETSGSKNSPRRVILIAGLLILIAGLGYVLSTLLNSQSPKDMDDIYAMHWQPLENRIALITRGSEASPLQEAMKKYDAKHYEIAYQELSQLPEEVRIPEVDLYRGISLMELEKYQEAFDVLDQTQFSNALFEFERLWNIGFIELLQGKREKAFGRFNALAKFENATLSQKDRISKLLTDINDLR